MSRVSNPSPNAATSPAANGSKPSTGLVSLAILASTMLFLPGCSYLKGGNHVIVGSVPDDYRTKHPISISEQEQHLDVPVGTSDKSLSLAQRSIIQGFIAQYSSNGSGPIQIALPSGSTNSAAASRVRSDVIDAIRKGGVTQSQVVTINYDASAGAANPIRISYRAITASTDQCGKWPDDIAGDNENKNYHDFGCSYQNNLAAQLANPADLLGPRKQGEIDARKRLKVINDYQAAGASTTREVSY
ncbi:MAG: CpaD family pilus assembly protein [Rhizobiaceae bacterium]